MQSARIAARFRITRRDRGERESVLRLEGRLDARDIRELAAACGACAGRRVVLDLSGLSFLAWDAARGLAALRRDGVGLRGGSGFVRELLRSAEESPGGGQAAGDGRREET